MATKKQIIIGLLIILISSTAIYVTLESMNVRMRIDNDKSTFYVYENNRWIISGIEYNKLYNGTSLLSRNVSGIRIETLATNNSFTIIRHTPYKNGIEIIDTYYFEGGITNVERFPIYHTLEIFNGKGLIYEYSVTNLQYNGITRDAISPERFGRSMKVEWQNGSYLARVYQTGILKIRYKIISSNQSLNVKLYDPTEISVCSTLNTANTVYNLIADITDSDATICMDITADNITLDCLGRKIDGNDGASPDYPKGININRGGTNSNITVQNCTITDWYRGIYMTQTNRNYIINNTISSNYDGLQMFSSASYNNITDNNLSNTNDNIYFATGCHYNNFINNTLTGGTDSFCIIATANNNTIINGSIESGSNSAYYIYNSNSAFESNNVFINTNFSSTVSRKILIGGDYLGYFNYKHNLSNNIMLKTNVSVAKTIVRTIDTWNDFEIKWNDSITTGTATGKYILTGLFPNSNYRIYNNSVLVYNLISNASGALNFTNNLATVANEIKINTSGGPIINCSSCSECNTRISNAWDYDTIQLIAPISNYAGTCISFSGKDNVTFDCLGNNIDGNSEWSSYYTGINLAGGSNNNTIKNCNITDFWQGVYSEQSNFNQIVNISSNNNQFGFYLSASHNVSFINSTANNNGRTGISIETSDNVTLRNTETRLNNYAYLVSDSRNMSLINVTVDSNGNGLYFVGWDTECDYLRIINSTISRNVWPFEWDDEAIGNLYQNNNFSHNVLPELLYFNETNRIYNPGQIINFTINMTYINGTQCSTCSYNITTSPNETVQTSKSVSQVIGNFTPSFVGTYTLIINITDNDNNNEIRYYKYLVNATANRTVQYYFRGVAAQPTHGQPVDIGTGSNDTMSLTFSSPSGTEDGTCGAWIQASPDDVPDYPVFLLSSSNMSFWYKTSTTGYIGLERYAIYSLYTDINQSLASAATYTFNRTIFTNINWSVDYYWNQYFISYKLGGTGPWWQTNTSNPGIANQTYIITSTPDIRYLSNKDIMILSSTSPTSSATNATVILDGKGSTNITIAMLNTAVPYQVKMDDVNCDNDNPNCNLTSQSSGVLNLSLVLGSIHTLSILGGLSDLNSTFGPPNTIGLRWSVNASGNGCGPDFTTVYAQPRNQTGTYGIFWLCNNGTASGNIQAKLSGTANTGWQIMMSNSSSVSNVVGMTTSFKDIYTTLGSNNCIYVWGYANCTAVSVNPGVDIVFGIV